MTVYRFPAETGLDMMMQLRHRIHLVLTIDRPPWQQDEDSNDNRATSMTTSLCLSFQLWWLAYSQTAGHKTVATHFHITGFSYLLYHMYTDILHRLQILRAHSLYKVLALIKQKESNRNLMYSYVRDTCLVRCFLCVCVVQGSFTFFIFTHRDKYIPYKLIKQFQDTQILPLLHTAGTWQWMIVHRLTVYLSNSWCWPLCLRIQPWKHNT